MKTSRKHSSDSTTLDLESDADLATYVEYGLRTAVNTSMTPGRVLLTLSKDIYIDGISNPEDLDRFYRIAAPIARRVWLETSPADFASEFSRRMADLERADQLAARIVDLVYFAQWDLKGASILAGVPLNVAKEKLSFAEQRFLYSFDP